MPSIQAQDLLETGQADQRHQRGGRVDQQQPLAMASALQREPRQRVQRGEVRVPEPADIATEPARVVRSPGAGCHLLLGCVVSP